MTTASVASARVSVRDGRLTWASTPPVVLRRTGPRQVHVIAVGGGPLGGDQLRLTVDVGPGEQLTVHSAAATVVQPGREPGAVASFAVEATVAGEFVWRPEPTVVCDRAVWAPSISLHVAGGARAQVLEQLVLGRAGQRGGRCSSSMSVAVDGRPLLATTTVLDGADPGLSGIGGTAGGRSVGTVLEVGDAPGTEDGGEDGDVTWARTPLDGPGSLLSAVGTVRGVARVLGANAERTPAGVATGSGDR
ncbi:urease accessory protein UreD [Actinomycetospora termitidis]|uniref:Urease accessory protein UreD n=1 Tax=Actinomycetospora termitidis TaxID=3053470 RepID=A0ABT7MD71_9PSEU|nr:urease accessory protein UreD [Actinomycetospora sp. Odt1-22]MDL5158618.1 urease accessory protein UreD [Actinomycetospora sp. Odt1-22]